MSAEKPTVAWPDLKGEEGETVMAPVQQLVEAELPDCLYEIGTLMHGLPAFCCPRCQLYFNCVDVVTPQCVHCGLKPRTLTAAEMADILIPPRVVDAVLEAAREQ